ncbi:3-deoxy-manno-octulosonate cytidylyltransferase [Candidatus Scalindua japonica]|uniref:3-deoxy-manno-octulosonate cytidylyltransferase n=1 Tax=Candidatus Scalindua japonica TaxID=1284222 RepID=A0A286TX87_9BACT|nr:3-deoxy-manno-octulosonate cytidylyltransferase [Candidatus Scalindua japonica]GAX60509.1 3-deoxy-manno-octulosonate cytidylyltransferase [Candidatus Scalindua japonica]
MSKTAAIIPARYASTRLPGKLIKSEASEQTGKYLIEHVYNKVMEAEKVNEVVIATDDERIAEVVRSFGGCVKMTSINHSSGTDRVAEIASTLDVDYVVNIQGDEPDIKGSMIDDLIDAMSGEKEAVVCTFANTIKTVDEFVDPNVVKVVIDKDNYALYFSRAPIPFIRDGNIHSNFSIAEEQTLDEVYYGSKTSFHFLKHLGIYMYRKEFLMAFSSLPIPEEEELEKLEQLRILFNGYKIKVVVTPFNCEGVDTPEDFERFLEKYRNDSV